MTQECPIDGTEWVGDLAPNGDQLKCISKTIFDSEEPLTVKYTIRAKGKKDPITIHCVARHEQVYNILKGPLRNKVDLSQYDNLLEAITGDVQFFLGNETEGQGIRWEILKAALGSKPALTRNNTDYFEDIGRRMTEKAVSYIYKNQTDPAQFNIVREYGFLVPYFAASEFTGVSLPKSPSLLLRFFTAMRNKANPGKVKLKGEMAASSELLMWSHLIFGHMFANIGRRDWKLNLAAPIVARKFNRQIKRSIRDADEIPEGSLLDRFLKVKGQFTECRNPRLSNKQFEKHIRLILFELTGTMQLLVGSAFANILAVIEDEEIGLDTFLDHVEENDIALDEALRLRTPTTSLYRVAKEDFELDGQQIKEGDRLCLMVQYACKDEAVFPNPDTFSVEKSDNVSVEKSDNVKRNPKDYLSFGPYEMMPNDFNPTDNSHPCFGQYWARSLLKSMLKGVTKFANLKIATAGKSVLTPFQAIPDAIMASHNHPDEKKQNFVTICSEVCESKSEQLDKIRTQIEKLGNPAALDVKKSLDDSGLIHFMSINLVEGVEENNEPSFIFLEMSVDGGKEKAIESICEHLKDRLFGIYSIAGLVSDNTQLYDHLADNSVEMIQSIWPQFYSGNWRNGLGFTGTPQLSIQQIKDEDLIARFAQDQIDPQRSGLHENSTELDHTNPWGLLKHAQEKLDKEERSPVAVAYDRWKHKTDSAPIFAESSDSPWKSQWDTLTLAIKATPDVVKVWVIVLYLAMASMIWNLLFQYSPIPEKANTEDATTPVSDPSFWKFPGKLGEAGSDVSIYVSFSAVFYSLAIALAFTIAFSWAFSKLLPKVKRKTGAIFTFLFMIFVLMYLAPNIFDPSLSWFETITGASHVESIQYGVFVTESIVAISLYSTLILVFVTLLVDRKGIKKSGSAFIAYFAMFVLVLTFGDLHMHLMATNPSVLTTENWDGLGGTVINRWDTASLGKMIFYPLSLATLITASGFAFNASYPKFKFFTSRKVYRWVFAGLVIFFFVTAFYANDRPDANRVGSFFLAFILALPATIFALIGLASFVWFILTKSETNNTPVDQDPDVGVLTDMMSREDTHGAQNHMISIQRLLPEQWRLRFFLPLALHIVSTVLVKNRYRPGFLATVGTVHYARWIHLAKTNNFIFVSNYDGSWESYLEDFITKSVKGMTGIWSNCEGFPRAKNLFFEGAADGDRFKRWARGSMKPTSFWYSAYPHITAEEIRRNTLIRDGLVHINTPSDAEAWVDLFGSIPRPTFALQSDKIQSILFGGAGKLRCGRLFVVRGKNFEGINTNLKEWVKHIEPQITFGDSPPQKHAMYLGFSSEGMTQLGCNKGLGREKDCVNFPPAFEMGMDNEARASVLGDLDRDGESNSKNWNWGSREKEEGPHAVLLIYGESEEKNIKMVRHPKIEESAAFKELVDEQRRQIEDVFNLELVKEIEFSPLAEKGFSREPFGFADGISQPLIRGTKLAAGRGGSIHAVNPGEFILGYKDNRGFYPPSPQVPQGLDEKKVLPAIPRAQPQRYPNFHSGEEDKYRDIGRNGSYLVIRQLEQDVDAFNSEVKRIARGFESACPISSEEMIKAKLMGRWPDGHSLISRPIEMIHEDGRYKLKSHKSSQKLTRESNEFLLGKDDPQGHKCPFGSHTRRSNPRDGLDVENEDGLSIANRHRILRRGRSYKEIDNGVSRTGTMFMCLNADIERQFEFVQQTWIGSNKFHGLSDEVDPITGQGYTCINPDTKDRSFKIDDLAFTIQDPIQSMRVDKLKPFVTMRGGGYFFVPGKEALEFIADSANNEALEKCVGVKSP